MNRMAALAVGVCVVALVAPAQAQASSFDIPAGNLRSALDTFGRQSGKPIIYKVDEVSGLRSKGYRGTAAPMVALDAILAGTGFRVRLGRSGAVAIVKAANTAAIGSGPEGEDLAQNAPSTVALVPVQQTNEAAQQEQSQDIVVTGSLVAKSGFDMPTPVTVIDETDLARIGAPDIADVINQTPSIRASLTNDTTANQSGSAGGTFADLRGLGASRTLVMVDGRRYSPTNATGGVSTAALPQAMLKGVDIVTGGASAAYGSDAVAGVINYKVNDRLKGFKGTIQGGISDYGDYENYLASLAYGTSFFNGRARLIVAGEIADNRGIRAAGDRPWADNVVQMTNPAYTATNGEPQRIIVSGTRYSGATYGGVITGPTAAATAGLTNLQFMPDGSAVPFNRGSFMAGGLMVGGDGADRSSTWRGTIPQNRRALFGRLNVDVGDSTTLFVEGNYSRVTSVFDSSPGTESLTIRRENPYLPQSVRDVMTARNIPTITIGRAFQDNRLEARDINVKTYRVLVGAEGRFGDSWNWDAYYSGGWTDHTTLRLNARVAANFALALDAVVNPANGAIVCRSTLTNPTNGCVPINLIGEGNATREALAYTNAEGIQHQDLRQHVISGKVRGEPFSTWAGPVAVAFGAEHRWVSAKATADALSEAYAFTTGGYSPWEGKVNVKEAFAEALVPLAKGARFAENLSLNLAGRITDYSTSGTVYTWKVGANYSPVSDIRFRATRSRDIRAPNIGNLYTGGSSVRATIDDYELGQRYDIVAMGTGNPQLTPEIADTVTAGVIFSPRFLPRFQFSVDYWDIQMKDAIITLTPAIIVKQCYEGRTSVCSAIMRPSPTERITHVINGPVNFLEMSARGVDFEASYKAPLWGGQFSLRALATYFHRGYVVSAEEGVTVLHDSVEQGAPATIGGTPHWKANVRVTYSKDGGFISLAGRYVGGGRIDPDWTEKDIYPARVNGRLYLDISAEYPLIRSKGDSVRLFGSVRNLLDNYPPLTGESNFATTRSLFDVVGRTYSAGIKFRF